MALVHLSASQHARIPWKNGLGISSVIASDPAGAGYDALLWQVAGTEIGADCPFSELRGLDRQFMVIDGDGVELTSIDEAGKTRQARVLPMRAPYPFHGDWKTSCSLLGGPVRVLNVVTRRGQVYADMDYSDDVVLVKSADETVIAVQPASLDAWMLSGPRETTWQTPSPDERLIVVRITAIRR